MTHPAFKIEDSTPQTQRLTIAELIARRNGRPTDAMTAIYQELKQKGVIALTLQLGRNNWDDPKGKQEVTMHFADGREQTHNGPFESLKVK